ncbi:MAG: NAD(P)-dependent oxidoreductase [Ruminococcus sp.]|nr:NAD(P)-dependent oxidoreductase [Ruminococcus sp.]
MGRQKILVTGANSFIGRHLCERLLREGREVIAVVRKGRVGNCRFAGNFENGTFLEAGMEEYGGLKEKLAGKQVDIVIHLAWDGVRGSKRQETERQYKNYQHSMELLSVMAEQGCSAFMTAGSQAEYGICNSSISEETVCVPNTEYGKYKLQFYREAEQFCKPRRIRIIEPRFFSLYGEDDTEETMIISILKNMLNGEPCDLTEGRQMWDFLHIEDAVTALVRLLETEEAEGVYNFGSGIAQPLREYILIMQEVTKSKSQLNWGKIPYPESGMVSLQPDITKLAAVVGWKPEISFEEGIKRIVSYLKAA